jgi:hypothetical protein
MIDCSRSMRTDTCRHLKFLQSDSETTSEKIHFGVFLSFFAPSRAMHDSAFGMLLHVDDAASKRRQCPLPHRNEAAVRHQYC